MSLFGKGRDRDRHEEASTDAPAVAIPVTTTPATNSNTTEEKKMAEQEVGKALAFDKQSLLGVALEESINAATDYVAKASSMLNSGEVPGRGDISVKRCRRSSITLTDELVELRKLLP